MIRAGLTCLLILFALPVQAHGTLPGGGGFYSGALHPLVALEQLVVLLSAGLILGRDGMRRPLWALFAGLGIGIWLGGVIVGLSLALLVVTLGYGAVLALQIRLPEWLYGALFLAVGLAVGFDTDLPPLNLRMAALGVGVSVFLITMNAFAIGSALAGSRAAIALRIAGAWLLAAALMVLALQLRTLP
jgi:hydrogenase/urease accessory protein HupE